MKVCPKCMNRIKRAREGKDLPMTGVLIRSLYHGKRLVLTTPAKCQAKYDVHRLESLDDVNKEKP